MVDNCPFCGVSLIGGPIPEELRASGAYGDSTHWRREIGIEVRGVYDGVLYWRCPDCDHKFHRWPEGHHLHKRAAYYVNQ